MKEGCKKDVQRQEISEHSKKSLFDFIRVSPYLRRRYPFDTVNQKVVKRMFSDKR